jgi:hypothetical protein
MAILQTVQTRKPSANGKVINKFIKKKKKEEEEEEKKKRREDSDNNLDVCRRE